MVDFIMTWLLRIVCYGIQIGGFALIAWGLAKLAAKGKQKAPAGLFVLFLALECIVSGYIAYYPAVIVPEEYEGYVSREEIGGYASGVYSANIPIFPVCAGVTYADADETKFTIWYLFWGSVDMRLSPDGANIDRPLISS